MFETVDAMATEHAELEQQLGAAETHADARLAKKINQRYALLSKVLTTKKEWDDLEGDIEAARELATEDPTFADEVESPGRAPARGRGAAPAAAGATRPHRRQGRHPRGEVRRGRRGVGAVRRRPAAHVHPVRRAAGLEGRGPRRHRVRPGRLQVRDRGREGQGDVRARARRRTACSSSRAACTGSSGCRSPSRRAGCTPARPVCSCCRRPSRSTSRSTRTTCGSTSSAAAAPAARASTPPTRRSGSPTCPPASWSAARTRRASSRTRSRRCASCAPGCSPRAQEEADAAASDARRSQVRTVDRSERIRTYNFPENRISDHRTGYKAYNLDQVLDGDLQPVLDSCVQLDLADRLAALES